MSRLSSRQPDEAVPVTSKEPDVTVLDSRPARVVLNNTASPQRLAPRPGAPKPPAGEAPAGQPAAQEPAGQLSRDPMARLAVLFDPDTLRLLLPADSGGVLIGEGLIGGMPAVAFASDPRVQ